MKINKFIFFYFCFKRFYLWRCAFLVNRSN